jgi:hypothetical protein
MLPKEGCPLLRRIHFFEDHQELDFCLLQLQVENDINEVSMTNSALSKQGLSTLACHWLQHIKLQNIRAFRKSPRN